MVCAQLSSSTQQIHLVKLAVGAQSINDLQQRQGLYPAHVTRVKPKRADDILACGGSIYWVIQRKITCRQKIVAFEEIESEGIKKCRIKFDKTIVPVANWPRSPFQGWRYLMGDVPLDMNLDSISSLSEQGQTDLPLSLLQALDRYGII